MASRPFIVERRAIAPRQRQARAMVFDVELKPLLQDGRLAREISRALRMSPLRFPRDWIAL